MLGKFIYIVNFLCRNHLAQKILEEAEEMGTASVLLMDDATSLKIDETDLAQAIREKYHEIATNAVHRKYATPTQTMRITFM